MDDLKVVKDFEAWLREPEAATVDAQLVDWVLHWIRYAMSADDWLEFLDARGAASREAERTVRIERALEFEEQKRLNEDEAARREGERRPGTTWSRHLRYLETLTTDERLALLRSVGYIGPESGFATLERHLCGEVTERESQAFGATAWHHIGSAFAELRTLERLTFYRIPVRFVAELPNRLNPDFLVIDTLGEVQSLARIRPLEVKSLHLDRITETRSAPENAALHFERKLEKAARQIAEGMRRYGSEAKGRREASYADELGGIAYFVVQSRAPLVAVRDLWATTRELLVTSLHRLDAEEKLDVVDAVIVVLDYLEDRRVQRPVLALHRSGRDSWTEDHPYLHFLNSEHRVPRDYRLV